MTRTPNIFRRATSELSQDALLAWLLSWADLRFAGHPSGLHEIARRFIAWLYSRVGVEVPSYIAVDVKRQHLRIDVLLVLVRENGDKHYLIIEDKTYTIGRESQPASYKKVLIEKESIQDEAFVQTIYFKSSLEAKKPEGLAYAMLPEIMQFFGAIKDSEFRSEVLSMWIEARSEELALYEKYNDLPIGEWEVEQWLGCLNRIASLVPDEWKPGFGDIPNPAGGFVGLWFGWQEHPNAHYSYMQIDVYPKEKCADMTFRISSSEGNKVTTAMSRELHQALKRAAEKLQLRIARPARLGPGQSTRIGYLDQPFLGPDGTRFNERFCMKQLAACRELLSAVEARLPKQ